MPGLDFGVVFANYHYLVEGMIWTVVLCVFSSILSISGGVLLAVAGITGFGPVEDGAYRGVHESLQEAEKTVYDLVPGGDEIRRLNQPYVDVR